MERTLKLKDKLNDFLCDFNASKINEYFATDFSDDWDNIYIKEDYPNIEDVLNYLNDSFIEIDIDNRNTDSFENKVKEVLEKALKMLEN